MSRNLVVTRMEGDVPLKILTDHAVEEAYSAERDPVVATFRELGRACETAAEAVRAFDSCIAALVRLNRPSRPRTNRRIQAKYDKRWNT
jgi:hypothetical protein